MAAYFVFFVILGTMVYGMEEPSIGGEIKEKRSDGLVHDVVRQMVAEHIERMKIVKVFGQMKNELQYVKRKLKERNTQIHNAQVLHRKLLQEIKDVKQKVTEASMAKVKEAIKGCNMTVKAATNRMKETMKRHENSIKLGLTDTNKKVFNIQRSLKNLQYIVGENEKKVAFTAKIQSDVTTSSAIIFKTVITNIGGGYNSTDGIFYCPKAGLYLFSSSLMVNSQRFVDGKIMKNNKETVWFHENIVNNYYPSATAGVILKLAVGDKVWVKGHGIRYHAGVCSFAGVLIKN